MLEWQVQNVNQNIYYFTKYVQKNLKKLEVIKPEGTYMLWVDFRKFNLSQVELNDILINKCNLGLSDGKIFGNSGIGFQRFNLACPRVYILEALDRLMRLNK